MDMTSESQSPETEAVILDIVSNTRGFLRGPVPTIDDVRANLKLPILVGDLEPEEVALILSALPKGAGGVYLTGLDKGLSGAKVFSARYEVGARRAGKVFVVKLSDASRVEREASAIERLVLPDVYGVARPVYRLGPLKGLLVQEFVGLSAHSRLLSLREHIGEGHDPAPVIRRLLLERLANWYRPHCRTSLDFHGTQFA